MRTIWTEAEDKDYESHILNRIATSFEITTDRGSVHLV